MAVVPAEYAKSLLREARDTHPWLHHRLFQLIWEGRLSRSQVQQGIRQQGWFFRDTLRHAAGKIISVGGYMPTLEDLERQLDEIDHQIEEMESLLVATPSNSLEEIEAVVRLTVTRFHEIMVTDPNDVFYDHGEARLVALIERVQDDLSGLIRRSRSDAN